MGDFNTHHTTWGCHSSAGFALVLVDIIDDANLCILNDGLPTRRGHPNQNHKSAVNLSLSSTWSDEWRQSLCQREEDRIMTATENRW
ncbi:unnamed protein product [Euphydryas editha]|uniref:Endonuclease/exonuclease/phosphatase domain-containing protein n=1 Tax=Euphydryas editha TaxID=104508 RepID=A0AAU9U2C6_EUPED|nr:unnamed protein product [Euphydryas editha]